MRSVSLTEQGMPLSATAVREVLAADGFAPLPRRLDEARPAIAGPSTEAVANAQSFRLTPRELATRFTSAHLERPVRQAAGVGGRLGAPLRRAEVVRFPVEVGSA